MPASDDKRRRRQPSALTALRRPSEAPQRLADNLGGRGALGSRMLEELLKQLGVQPDQTEFRPTPSDAYNDNVTTVRSSQLAVRKP